MWQKKALMSCALSVQLICAFVSHLHYRCQITSMYKQPIRQEVEFLVLELSAQLTLYLYVTFV